MFQIKQISDNSSLLLAKDIRYNVFCKEQGVNPEADWDNKESVNYLAFVDNKAVATIRWRSTGRIVKIERLCVLEEYRKQGIARKLMEKVLEDIKTFIPKNNSIQEVKISKILLHSQLSALSLYESLGFKKQGKMFVEQNIKHYTMTIEL
ncbi:MAG: GNAT family N-acetyltransferase [Bacteroidales bacterium]|nr:GNAT family N-acetyltransferase [Bacteroidales bacterium]